jgi:hypothetical protein
MALSAGNPTAAIVQVQPPSLASAIVEIARQPGDLVWRRWNWKAALLSIFFRAPIFLIASLRAGWRETLTVLLAESVYCAGTAGFYGALVEAIRDARPQWLTGLTIAFLLPALMQAVEYGMHWLRGTHHLRAALIGSVIVSGLSSLFNWFVMKSGALLIGEGRDSFASDLQRLPLLAVSFLISGPRWLWRRLAAYFSPQFSSGPVLPSEYKEQQP